MKVRHFATAPDGIASRGKFALDSLLEQRGFEPPVPPLQKALLDVANRDVGTISGTTKGHVRDREHRLGAPPTAGPFAAGPMVRIRFPPSEESGANSGNQRYHVSLPTIVDLLKP
jgi:hypothetical protein